MTIEKYSFYEFSIIKNKDHNGFVYEIYTSDVDYIKWMKTNLIRESEEWFDTEQQARFAAVGHINLLESGEG